MRVIKTDQNLYQHEEEYDYTPTPMELYFYYSGTSVLDRDNPYAQSHGARVTKWRYKLVTAPTYKEKI